MWKMSNLGEKPVEESPQNTHTHTSARGDTKGGGPGHLSVSNRFWSIGGSLPCRFSSFASVLWSCVRLSFPWPWGLPNLGNTCFAAVAIRCLSCVAQHSQVDLSTIRDPHLRNLLLDLSPSQWESFCQRNKLVRGQPQDAVVCLQQHLDLEPIFHSLVDMSESLGLSCVGCDEPKVLESSFHIWRIPVPAQPVTLQELVANHCQCCADDPYFEITCLCCFAIGF